MEGETSREPSRPSDLQRLAWCERAPHWSSRVPERGLTGGARERGRRAHAALAGMSRGDLERALGMELAGWEVERGVAGERWVGRLDLLAVGSSGERVPVEVKSTRETRRMVDALQLLAYAVELERESGEACRRGLVWYVRQGEVWEVEFCEELRSELGRWESRLRVAIESDLPPDVEARLSACSLCPYTARCADEPHGERGEERYPPTTTMVF